MTTTTHILIGGPNQSASELRASALASARLRLAVAATAAQELDHSVSIGEQCPERLDRLIVGKIGANDIEERQHKWLSLIEQCKGLRVPVILDYTDHHLANNSVMTAFYRAASELADIICVPTKALQSALAEEFEIQSRIAVVPDLLEYEPVKPKDKLVNAKPVGLWFGHPTNATFLAQFIDSHRQELEGHSLNLVSSSQTLDLLQRYKFSQTPTVRITAFAWSVPAVAQAAQASDYCIIPSDCESPKRYASNNRLVTALALGLPTLATALPSYSEFGDYFAAIGSPEENQFLNCFDVGRGGSESFQQNHLHTFTLPELAKQWRALLH
jgi:hypothetical protein